MRNGVAIAGGPVLQALYGHLNPLGRKLSSIWGGAAAKPSPVPPRFCVEERQVKVSTPMKPTLDFDSNVKEQCHGHKSVTAESSSDFECLSD
jgi:hypothetical protein